MITAQGFGGSEDSFSESVSASSREGVESGRNWVIERQILPVSEGTFLVELFLAILAGNPEDVGGTGVVADAGHDEEEIGEAVEIFEGEVIEVFEFSKAEDFDFGAAADSAGVMDNGRGARSTGENEALEGAEAFDKSVNPLLKLGDLAFRDAECGGFGFLRRFGDAEIRTEIEEVVLDVEEDFDDFGRERFGEGKTEGGIELVDGAVGDDARMGLGDPGSISEAGLAFVSGTSVNAIEVNHR